MPGLIPDSYDCKTCGENHKFGTWVYSQWEKEVQHTCLSCNTAHIIIHGIAEAVDGIRKATA